MTQHNDTGVTLLCYSQGGFICRAIVDTYYYDNYQLTTSWTVWDHKLCEEGYTTASILIEGVCLGVSMQFSIASGIIQEMLSQLISSNSQARNIAQKEKSKYSWKTLFIVGTQLNIPKHDLH